MRAALHRLRATALDALRQDAMVDIHHFVHETCSIEKYESEHAEAFQWARSFSHEQINEIQQVIYLFYVENIEKFQVDVESNLFCKQILREMLEKKGLPDDVPEDGEVSEVDVAMDDAKKDAAIAHLEGITKIGMDECAVAAGTQANQHPPTFDAVCKHAVVPVFI